MVGAAVEQRFAAVDARFEILEARLLGQIDSRIAAAKTDLLRWMFIFWTGNVLAIIAARLFLH